MPRLPACLFLLLPVIGCAAPGHDTAPVQVAALATSSDPTLLSEFFGPGSGRAISPVIRCPIRCQHLPR